MTAPICSFDIETHATVNLKSAGAQTYLHDVNTDAVLFAWHMVGEPQAPEVWFPRQPCPPRLVQHIQHGGYFSGWNVVNFDAVAWDTLLVARFGFPRIARDRWQDSMHLAAAANLPRSLDGCAKALGVPFVGDLKDNRQIARITDKKKTPVIQGADLDWLTNRCIQDVVMEEETLKRLPPWFDMEPWRRMREIDREINDRGILADVDLIRGLEHAATIETKRLDAQMKELTGGAVRSTSVVEQLKTWLISQGVRLPLKDSTDADDEGDDDAEGSAESEKAVYRLRKSDIADLLARDDIPEKCRLALEWRAEAAKASVKKLRRMLSSMGPDGRLRGALVLGGAQQTFRWSGAAWQPHNFVRDAIANPDEVEMLNGVSAKKNPDEFHRLENLSLTTAIDVGRSGDRDAIEGLFTMTREDAQKRVRVEGVLPWIGRMLRRTLTAERGKVFLNGDYSQIEARIPMWLAGQEDKVQVFVRGEDIYRVQAAPLYGLRPEELNKTQRQIGKVEILFLGFAGGVNAFIPAAMNYGLRITLEDATPIVRSFREDNPFLVAFWNANLEAAVNAVMSPGTVFYVAPKNLIAWCMDGNCLCCRLPSGRLLRYWAPRLQQGYWQDGSPKNQPDLTVLAIKGRAVFRRTLWRGLAMENSTQGIAADILAQSLVNMYDAGLPVVLHVHDADVAEVPERDAERLLPLFEQCMLSQAPWTEGLPIAVSTDISARFG